MPLPRPIDFCPICADPIHGRRDKIFCTPNCKAIYHRRRKAQLKPIADPIDSMIHRNWVILRELYDEIGKKKFFVPMARLNKAGFQAKYLTSYQSNKDGKIYHYVYDFAWMQFSEKEVMIIKRDKAF